MANRVELTLEILKAARKVKNHWARNSFEYGYDVQYSSELMINLANAFYRLDDYLSLEHPPSTTSVREGSQAELSRGSSFDVPPGEEVIAEILEVPGDRANDGPQDSHHEAAGPPSEAIPGPGKGPMSPNAWRYELDKQKMIHIYCAKCGTEIRTIQESSTHSCQV